MSRNEDAFMAGLISGFSSEEISKEAGAASKILSKLKGAAGKAKEVAAKHPVKAGFAAGAGVSALLQKILGGKKEQKEE
jgi:hypothetical protein